MNRKIIRYFSLYFLIANLYLGLSYLPTYLFFRRTQPDRVFHFDHVSWTSDDYNVYLSVITQGRSGRWLMHDAYTSEPTNPTVFYFFYILLGKVSALTGLSSGTVYQAAKFLFAESTIVLVYLLCRKILQPDIPAAFTAAVFSFIATVSPLFLYHEPNKFRDYTPWWSFQDALKRLQIMPHYFATDTLLLIILLGIIRMIRKHTLRPLPVLAVLAFLSGIFLPSSIIPLVAAVPGGLILDALMRKLRKQPQIIPGNIILAIIVIIAAALLAMGILKHEETNGFPWQEWTAFELGRWNAWGGYFKQMVITIGPVQLLAIPGIILAILSGSAFIRLVAVWSLLPYILTPVFEALSINRTRLLNTLPHLPLAVCAAYALAYFAGRKPGKIMALVLGIAFVGLSLWPTAEILSFYVYLGKNHIQFLNFVPPKTEIALFDYINKNIPPSSVILGDFYTGNMLPAYAPVTSYVGHFVHTRDYFAKKPVLESFYKHEMTDARAKAFLATGRISYVIYGWSEMSFAPSFPPYPFLEKIQSSGDFVLYKLK